MADACRLSIESLSQLLAAGRGDRVELRALLAEAASLARTVDEWNRTEPSVEAKRDAIVAVLALRARVVALLAKPADVGGRSG